jgi:hypothetical protein
MGTPGQDGGIDARSTADDVRDALDRAGLHLHLRNAADGRAEAAYGAGQSPDELDWVAGEGADEAARAAWSRYLERQGGHGVS